MSADHSRPAHSPVSSPSSDSRTATSDVNGSRRPVRPRGPRVSMVVEQLWQPVPGGSGTYIVELSRALRARQVPVAGITARHQAAPSPREMGLPPMPMRSSHLPRAALYESWNRLGRAATAAQPPCSPVGRGDEQGGGSRWHRT